MTDDKLTIEDFDDVVWPAETPYNTTVRFKAMARAYLEGETIWWCEKHRAAVHQPETTQELRCDVWVVAGLDGWPTSVPCRMVSRRLVVEIEED